MRRRGYSPGGKKPVLPIGRIRQRPVVTECSACHDLREKHVDVERDGWWGLQCTVPGCTCWRPMFKVSPPIGGDFQ